MAKPVRLRGDALKTFLGDVRILTRRGFLKPTPKRGAAKATKYRVKRVKELQDIVRLDLYPLRKSKAVLGELKDAGYTVARGRAAVPKSVALSERKRSRKEFPKRVKRPGAPVGGIKGSWKRRIKLPKDLNNIDAVRQAGYDGALDKLKRKDEYWAFSVYGNNSNFVMSNGQLLAEYLEEYDDEEGGGDGFFDDDDWNPDEYTDDYDDDEAEQDDPSAPFRGNFRLYALSVPDNWEPPSSKRRPKYTSYEERRDASMKGWDKRGRSQYTPEQKREMWREYKRSERAARYDERKRSGGNVRSNAGKPQPKRK